MSMSPHTAPVPDSALAQPQPADHVLQLATGYILSSALQVAARLEIAGRLASGALPVEDLAAATRTDPDALYRVLRALSSAGVFQEVAPRRFGLNAAADLLRTDHPQSVHPMVLWMTDAFHFNVYAEALHSVRTGRPAIEKTHNMPVFEFFPRNPDVSAVFNNAMTMFSRMIVPAVLETYDFSDAGLVVDVAGGHGGVLAGILEKHPHLHGVLFDLEHVIAGSRERIAALGLSDRVRVEAGDFFEAVPAGDTYVLKHIIHDWTDDQALVILKNIRAAMRDRRRGKVVLLESVIRAGNTPDMAKLIDLEMLLLPGGRERTAEEYATLFERAGFTVTRIVPNASPLSVIEARPEAARSTSQATVIRSPA